MVTTDSPAALTCKSMLLSNHCIVIGPKRAQWLTSHIQPILSCSASYLHVVPYIHSDGWVMLPPEEEEEEERVEFSPSLLSP